MSRCGTCLENWNSKISHCPHVTAILKSHGKTDLLYVDKRVRQGYMLYPYLFNLFVKYILRKIGLEEDSMISKQNGEITYTVLMTLRLILENGKELQILLSKGRSTVGKNGTKI